MQEAARGVGGSMFCRWQNVEQEATWVVQKACATTGGRMWFRMQFVVQKEACGLEAFVMQEVVCGAGRRQFVVQEGV
jgi:hypothetical protein